MSTVVPFPQRRRIESETRRLHADLSALIERSAAYLDATKAGATSAQTAIAKAQLCDPLLALCSMTIAALALFEPQPSAPRAYARQRLRIFAASRFPVSPDLPEDLAALCTEAFACIPSALSLRDRLLVHFAREAS